MHVESGPPSDTDEIDVRSRRTEIQIVREDSHFDVVRILRYYAPTARPDRNLATSRKIKRFIRCISSWFGLLWLTHSSLRALATGEELLQERCRRVSKA